MSKSDPPEGRAGKAGTRPTARRKHAAPAAPPTPTSTPTPAGAPKAGAKKAAKRASSKPAAARSASARRRVSARASNLPPAPAAELAPPKLDPVSPEKVAPAPLIIPGAPGLPTDLGPTDLGPTDLGPADLGELPAPPGPPPSIPGARTSRASVRPTAMRMAGSREAPARRPEGAVVVTGICGRLGKLLARRLHRVDEVIGIDRRDFRDKPKDVVHHQIDLRRKKTRDVFRTGGIRAVVHLGIMHDLRRSSKEHHSYNVVAFQKLLDYMAHYDVPKLVVLSTANVYGPRPENPQFLTEEAPLLGAQHFSEIRDLVTVDMLAQSFFWRHPETETVILRPCHILGGVKNAPSNYLRLPRPMTILGYDPMVQVIHERDVVRAIQKALEPGVRGIFNLRGPGEVPLSKIHEILGRRPRPLPGFLAETVLSQLWRYRMTSFPMPELDHIRYLCMVDDSRAREILGFAPKYDLEATVRAVETVTVHRQ